MGPSKPIRPKVRTGRVGRPGGITRMSIEWCIGISEHVQQQQINNQQTASGKTLRSWTIDVRNLKETILSASSVYQFLVSDVNPPGRGPTRNEGPGDLRRGIMQWMGFKGVSARAGKTLRQAVNAIVNSIHNRGNYLYRHRRTYSGKPGISLALAIEKGYDVKKMDKPAQLMAEETANMMVKSLTKTGTFKEVKK